MFFFPHSDPLPGGSLRAQKDRDGFCPRRQKQHFLQVRSSASDIILKLIKIALELIETFFKAAFHLYKAFFCKLFCQLSSDIFPLTAFLWQLSPVSFPPTAFLCYLFFCQLPLPAFLWQLSPVSFPLTAFARQLTFDSFSLLPFLLPAFLWHLFSITLSSASFPLMTAFPWQLSSVSFPLTAFLCYLFFCQLSSDDSFPLTAFPFPPQNSPSWTQSCRWSWPFPSSCAPGPTSSCWLSARAWAPTASHSRRSLSPPGTGFFLTTDFYCYSRLCWYKSWFVDLNWHVSVSRYNSWLTLTQLGITQSAQADLCQNTLPQIS